MKDFPIRTVFLPAVLVAGAVFSTLTLPLVAQQAKLAAIAPLPLLNQTAPIELNRVHKDIAIPYIGSAIILSVGAGIATAEVARKRHALKQSAAQGQPHQMLSASSGPFSEFAPEPYLESTLNSYIFDYSNSEFPDWGQIAQDSEDSVLLQGDDDAGLAHPQPFQSFKDSDGDSSTILVFPGQYQRCRIQVPHLRQRFYAIQFDGQFYSLLRVGDTKEQALSLVKQLARRKQPAIITPVNKGYAVWVLQPEGYLDAAA